MLYIWFLVAYLYCAGKQFMSNNEYYLQHKAKSLMFLSVDIACWMALAFVLNTFLF